MSKEEVKVFWVAIYKGSILLEKYQDKYKLPFQSNPPIDPKGATIHTNVALIEGHEVRSYSLLEKINETELYKLVGLRAAWELIPNEHHLAAGKCNELIHWDCTSNFCSVCGSSLNQVGPTKKVCSKCGFADRPKISTAVLILIRKADSICLVSSKKFQGQYFSLVAGYLEIGETLEECIIREIREELQIEVENIKYWGSQPWPYPSQNMVGFICDYKSGEIKLQLSELNDGGFFKRDNLPKMPGKMSMAYQMIQEWIHGQIPNQNE